MTPPRRLASVLLASFGLVHCLAITVPAEAPAVAGPAVSAAELFRRDRLIAWCIVPFDTKKRGPAERAEMLERLGFKHFAYDYRAEHVPTFDDEVKALQSRGVALDAWWFPGALNDEARKILAVCQRHDVHPQLWVTGAGGPTASPEEQRRRVESEAARLRPIVTAAAEAGCQVGLYNHGGWFGEPENQLAVIEELNAPNVGIVYNLHHGHEHLARFPELLDKIKSKLLVLNLNGMTREGDRRGQKILPLGQGELDLELLKAIRSSGYRGPFGVLGHTMDDAEARLLDNLDGLDWLARQLDGKPAGPRPTPRTSTQRAAAQPPATKQQPAKAQQPATAPIVASSTPGWLIAGRDEYRRPPLTVECRVRLDSHDDFNILMASDVKTSGQHWELFTRPDDGALTAYLPGYSPNHCASKVALTDGAWHQVAMQLAADRVRLFVDGRQVADQALKSRDHAAVPGDLYLMRLVEGDLGCAGKLAWARISSGLREPAAASEAAPAADEHTLGLWALDDDSRESEDRSANKNSARRVGAPPSPPFTGSPHAAPVDYDAAFAEALLADAQQHGDAQAGAAVFSSTRLACISCHRVGEHGGAVGPGLADVGRRLKPAEIVESLLWPKRQVKPEYSAWVVVLDDGRSLQGYKRGEPTAGKLEFFEPATGRAHLLNPSDIEDQRAVGTLMPDGLANAMSPTERRDVVRFLLELGHTPGLETLVRPETPAEFAYDRAPLDRDVWRLWEHPVNRDRVYDFYLKEALFFRGRTPLPHLLPAYPGLDGGKLGHWGNQNEQTWADDRWNQTDLGSMLSGVFHGRDGAVPKGVGVRLGDQGELATCFNPERGSYDALWQGDFFKFSGVRHSFLEGLRPSGEMLAVPAEAHRIDNGAAKEIVYHGLYRFGRRVVFAYRLGDVEMLDSPWVENGKFIRLVAPVEEHPLKAALAGGQAQWPEELPGSGEIGTGRPYAVDTISPPATNPWNALFFVGDHDFLPDGSAVVATMQGDVWRVTGLDAELKNVRWRRFAAGLNQPLGLVVAEGQVYVLGRDQITRLRDLNGDGEADFYECFSNKQLTSSGGHDFICGLARDREGRFYSASSKQGLIRFSADGQQVDVLATGFRNPDGVGLYPDGAVTVPCSEGDWTPASMVCLVKSTGASGAPPHFGFGGPKGGQAPSRPFVYLARGLDNSSGGQVYVPDDRWGPLAGTLVHFSFGSGSHLLVLRDEVDGEPQGAVVPLAGEFRSGAHRGKFNPVDGQLYVSGMSGWGSYTPDDGCFQRVRYTGQRVQLPRAFHVYENGVLVTFTAPLDASKLANVANHFAQTWNYRYSPGYGSPEFAPTHHGAVGHETLRIAGVHPISSTSCFVELPALQPVSQLHLLLDVDAQTPRELFITVNRLDKPFTEFPGYAPVAKTIAAHPMSVDLTLLGKTLPNPWRGRKAAAETLEISAGKNLTFSTRELRVKHGETVKLTFRNPDVVPHNWVLVKPGALARVGDLANKLVADPEAVMRHYVPKTPDVLVYTDIVPPQEQFMINFTAPKEPGRYPYLCSFPGHWMVMNGELIVE